jgi:predicted homoserine dehydrogenase-like protein
MRDVKALQLGIIGCTKMGQKALCNIALWPGTEGVVICAPDGAMRP